MRTFRKMLSHILLFCLCISLLALSGCDKLPLDKLPDGIQDILGVNTPPVETPTHEHSFVEHEGKAPTCTESGWMPYKTCTGCSETVGYTELDILEHEFSEEYVATGDNHSRFCVRCTETITEDHVWAAGDVLTAPTCLLGISLRLIVLSIANLSSRKSSLTAKIRLISSSSAAISQFTNSWQRIGEVR